jgi:hypothetical protein
MRNLARALLAASALAVASGPALAQDHGEHWRNDRDIHHFRDHDFDAWRGGRWFHVDHDGRPGWWWVVGDQWYFYPAPVYPYPDPYVPPVLAQVPVPAPVAPGATWYYCDNPAGYYPYVAQCAAPWRAVPAR